MFPLMVFTVAQEKRELSIASRGGRWWSAATSSCACGNTMPVLATAPPALRVLRIDPSTTLLDE
jgi:hypothetical protein